MVREEVEREAELRKDEFGETPFSQASISAETPEEEEERGAGLLSKMLRQPGVLAVRAVSLHNLLDQPPTSSQLQPPALVLSPSFPGFIHSKQGCCGENGQLWRPDLFNDA